MCSALEFARRMHEGQTRLDGSPYINHPIRVAENVKRFKKSRELDMLVDCAYLHDTLEDTNATYYDICEFFGPEIAGIVHELTTDEDLKKEIGKEKYLEIKMKNMSSWALVIKLCDRLDNVNDLDYADDAFKNKYINETLHILDYVCENRVLSNTHIEIMNEILSKAKLIKNNDVEINSIKEKILRKM